MTETIRLLVGTRKGAWMLHSDGARGAWRTTGPLFLGQIINHLVADPRDGGRTILAAAATGHLGPTILRSTDGGETWMEAKAPPAFRSGEPHGRAVHHTFWLEPGHPDEPGVWWAGASPPALFRSEDGGDTWEGVAGLNEHPQILDWLPPDGGTPDGAMVAGVAIDPRDARHMYLATCSAGVLETTDQGATWRPLNQNVEANFLPDPFPEYGQDAHHIALAPTNPDRLWQQNHCGVYRLDRPGERWERIGKTMPAEVGDIGFTIVPHARCDQTAWVFPMDGTEVWPRVSPGGRPAVYRTRDGGASWQRQDRGFPSEQAWFTVKRQAFCADRADPLGLYLGTTGGEIWMSGDEGESWRQICAHLPEIYSVTVAEAP